MHSGSSQPLALGYEYLMSLSFFALPLLLTIQTINMPNAFEHRRQHQNLRPALTIHCNGHDNKYVWTLDSNLAIKSRAFARTYVDTPYRLRFTVDPAYNPNQVARMICWFRYGSYPVHSTQVLHRNASVTLNQFRAAALLYRGHHGDKNDAQELGDPDKIHLRMLRLAGEYEISDLTTYCLEQIRNCLRRTPGFVWEIQAYRRNHQDVRDHKGLLEIHAKKFAEQATKFTKDVRFESTAKNDAILAWAVVSQLAKRTER